MQKYTIFIGIDMSKSWFDASLYWEGIAIKQPHQRFENTCQGFEAFLPWVQSQIDKHARSGERYFCMEHTGLYGLPLAAFLEQKQQPFVQECALRIARSLGLRRGKSDAADARAIARYAARHYQEVLVRPLPCQRLLEVQSLLSLRNRQRRYLQGLQVAARELEGFAPRSATDLVKRYNEAPVEALRQQLKELDGAIKAKLLEDEELGRLYKLVNSVIGIGPLIAAHLIVYTNGFTAFAKGRRFGCYIGVAPFGHQSGTSVHRSDRVSDLANKRLKALMSTAALVAARHDPEMRAFYQRQLLRNKEQGWILNAIKNKLVQRVFAVVKRGTPYVKRDTHLN